MVHLKLLMTELHFGISGYRVQCARIKSAIWKRKSQYDWLQPIVWLWAFVAGSWWRRQHTVRGNPRKFTNDFRHCELQIVSFDRRVFVCWPSTERPILAKWLLPCSTLSNYCESNIQSKFESHDSWTMNAQLNCKIPHLNLFYGSETANRD